MKTSLRAEREARNEFSCGLREKSQYARSDPTRPNPTQPGLTRPDPTRPNPTRPDPTRPDPSWPDPMTLLRNLFLWNGLTDSRAVFFVRCHHSIKFVFDRHRYPPVPATARGTCLCFIPWRNFLSFVMDKLMYHIHRVRWSSDPQGV